MAEEERKESEQDLEEEVIVIEDEEEGEKEEEEPLAEEELKQPEVETEEEQEKKGKGKKNWLLIGVAVAIVVILMAASAFLLLHKKKPPPKPKKHLITHKIKKPKPKPKKKKIAKPQVYNPIVDVHFINALRLQQKGKYREALEQLKRATVDLFISYYGIGYIYLRMGNIKKAKEYLFDKTKQYLLLAIHNNPNYVNGYVNLFRIYMATGDYKNAQRMIELLKAKQLANKEVELMETYYNYIVKKDSTGVFEMLAEYPESPLLLSLAGDYYLKQKNTKAALNYMEKAIKLYPMGGVFYNISLINTQNGLYKSAMRNIPKMYYMDFSKIPCKNYLAFFLLFRNRKYKAASEFLNLNRNSDDICFNHFKIIPEATSPLTIESYAYRINFNFIMASEILNMYLNPVNLLPNKAVPKIKLGQLYQQLGLPSKAAGEFEQAAHFSEAVLLSQYANKFYLQGRYKTALLYYKAALNKVPANPLLLYNVGILSLKLHDTPFASLIFERLINSYQQFPLPYLAMFIIDEVKGKHMDAIKYLSTFSQRVKSLSEGAQKKLKDLTIFADYIIDRVNFNKKRLKKLNDFEKKIFLLFEAALNEDIDYLYIQRAFEKSIHLNWNPESLITICNYFYKSYGNDFLKRVMATMYLMSGKPNKAYKALYNIKIYTSLDYYKLGMAYLIAGYPDIADNFFTKSILKGSTFYNAYVGKAIIQANKGSLTGIKYYLKIILKKENNLAWLNTDVFLSYKILLK